MSELTLTLLRLAFLVGLWIFVLFTVLALRRDRVGVRKAPDVQVVEKRFRFDGVHHVGGLVDAELFGDHGQLVFEHIAHAMLDRVFKNEVDGSHDLGLADAVDAADALLQHGAAERADEDFAHDAVAVDEDGRGQVEDADGAGYMCTDPILFYCRKCRQAFK